MKMTRIKVLAAAAMSLVRPASVRPADAMEAKTAKSAMTRKRDADHLARRKAAKIVATIATLNRLLSPFIHPRWQ